MPTWSVTIEVELERGELVSAELFELGAAGVDLNDGTFAPMPGAAPLAAGRARVVAYFAEREVAAEAAEATGGAVAEIADQDWGEKWKEGWQPFSIGRVFIRPSWASAAVPEGSVEVVLDPGMAFGTGTHGTTSLCLAAIDRFLRARPGASVVDVGTGSGLLAIAAKKLGAGRVAGNDNDPIAVQVARENAELNGVRLELSGDDVPLLRGPFDLVVANILANTLIELAPAIAAQIAPGGELLLSGILEHQAAEVTAAYVALGLRAEEGAREGEWSLLHLRKAR